VKITPQQTYIDNFDYCLPDERIAKYPLVKRDSSKLLVYKGGEITESVFSSIGNFLPGDSLLIYNNTRVIQARLHFRKQTGAQIEIFCLEPYQPRDYALIFQEKTKCSWVCLIGNLKKWKDGILERSVIIGNKEVIMKAERLQSLGDAHVVEFSWNNPDITFAELLDNVGELPIPPYLNRETEEADKKTYQTVFSKIEGSVAAPTAGLHFTPEVFSDLKKRGIITDEVTLHVGAGTFKPVKTETIENHTMHSEFISVTKETIRNLLDSINKKRRIIAVGTTSVRTLESLYYIGKELGKETVPELKVGQWQPYIEDTNNITPQEALENIIEYLERNNLKTLLADTQIIIAPGYSFKIVDGMITNFHQPKSTLLLLVSAFVNGEWKRIYDYALTHDFRFLSYGDSSLLLRV